MNGNKVDFGNQNEYKYKETDDKIGMLKEQKRITQLTRKYKEISKKADISEQLDRTRVSGYRRSKISK